MEVKTRNIYFLTYIISYFSVMLRKNLTFRKEKQKLWKYKGISPPILVIQRHTVEQSINERHSRFHERDVNAAHSISQWAQNERKYL